MRQPARIGGWITCVGEPCRAWGRLTSTVDSREARFRALFEASYGLLWAYARRRCGASDADDIVAEVLTVAWRRLDDIPAGDAALPWLYGVAYRVVANQRRGQARRGRLVARLGRQRQADPGDDGGDDPLAVAALQRLGRGDREILRLAAWEQLRAAEIAVVLGCSPNAAALRLSRARKRLRTALTELGSLRTDEQSRVTDA